jgi:hypothetical protein
MKRFMLFMCSKYYPIGGMEDFVNSYDTLDEAITGLKNHDNWDGHWNGEDGMDKWHIYDLAEQKIVADEDYSDNYEEQRLQDEERFKKLMENDKR